MIYSCFQQRPKLLWPEYLEPNQLAVSILLPLSSLPPSGTSPGCTLEVLSSRVRKNSLLQVPALCSISFEPSSSHRLSTQGATQSPVSHKLKARRLIDGSRVMEKRMPDVLTSRPRFSFFLFSPLLSPLFLRETDRGEQKIISETKLRDRIPALRASTSTSGDPRPPNRVRFGQGSR